MWSTLYRRLRALTGWRQRESDLDEEIRFHLSEESRERHADGVDLESADRAARRDFGNVTTIREATRDAWGWGSAERVLQDVRHGCRSIAGTRLVSTVAIASLALGIGGNTALFSVMNALVLRPLPVAAPDRLALVGDGAGGLAAGLTGGDRARR